jgi:cytochrome c
MLSDKLAVIGVMLLASCALGSSPLFRATASQPKTLASTRTAAPGIGTVGDARAGKLLYQSCMGCHSLDENDVGPKHRGVVGRKAGGVPGYAYSAVLRESGITWTPEVLDTWLKNPQQLVPGAKMFFSISDQQQRADIIAYLATEN